MRKPICVLAVILALSFLSACQPPVETTPTPGPTYSVTYIGNGNTTGSAPVDPTDYQEGQTVTVASMSAHGPLTANFFFAWNTQADGSGTYYFPNDTFPMETLNVTLYATWNEYHCLRNDDGLTVCGYVGPDTEVIIPASIKDYPVTAVGNTSDTRDFAYKTWLTGVTIPTSVTSIDNRAFSGTGLISVNIPTSVKSIGYSAFGNCANLSAVTIPPGVESIYRYAFMLCQSLTSVAIPETVTNLDLRVFASCSSLEKINVDPANPNYQSIDGIVFDKSGRILWEAPGGLTGNYALPVDVTSINDGAFYGCKYLTGVTIPENVTSIGESAFYDCSSLESIAIPEGITSIELLTFGVCKKLKTVRLPSSVTTIEETAFSGCYSLDDITLSENLTTIGWGAFFDCTSLTKITIPSQVTYISGSVFSCCSALADVTVLATKPPELGSNYVFTDCSSGLQIHVPSADLVPVYQAAAGWSNLLIVYP